MKNAFPAEKFAPGAERGQILVNKSRPTTVYHPNPHAMKSRLLPLLAVLALLVLPRPGHADTGITFQDFYDALAPDGDWVEIEEYGYCWRPFVDENWQPYTDGQWVYTDAGYTWYSNEPWGWATYHYGRWAKVKNWGWVWVPGYEWGPAWVSWRMNDDYIGWAALPPEAVWEPSVGFTTYVDIDYGIGPDWYVFCPVASFCAPRLRTVCLPRRNNLTIIANTVNITRIRQVNQGLIFNGGPDINVINRRAHAPLRRARLEREVHLDRTALRDRQLRNRLEGDMLKIPAPAVERRAGRPPAIAGRAGRNQVNRGWEGVGQNPELVRAYREKIRQEAERAGRKPHEAIVTQVQNQPPSNPTLSGQAFRQGNSTPPPVTDRRRSPDHPPAPQNHRVPNPEGLPTQANRPPGGWQEELLRRIEHPQRQAQNAESQRPRPPHPQQAQPARPPQPAQEAVETARRQQQAAAAREKILRAQREQEARRHALRQKQEQEAAEIALRQRQAQAQAQAQQQREYQQRQQFEQLQQRIQQQQREQIQQQERRPIRPGVRQGP